jgi:hypothetical protein
MRIIIFLLGALLGLYIGKIFHLYIKLPRLFRATRYSIGIYEGQSPLRLTPPSKITNPVLTFKDVTDVPAKYVADPFMINENSMWYMFFEVINNKSNKGEIGLAISDDGYSWDYHKIILDEPFHVSYPYVFKHNNEYYMIPESMAANSIRLYKAIDFPYQWSFEKILIHYQLADPSIFYYENSWWLFACDIFNESYLHLYISHDLYGPWIEHPKSPIVRGLDRSRPGGRVIKHNDIVIRYAQDDYPYYGRQVRAFIISRLTTEEYEEHEVIMEPVLKESGSGWNSIGMHHVDPHQVSEDKWIACVDGLRIRYHI